MKHSDNVEQRLPVLWTVLIFMLAFCVAHYASYFLENNSGIVSYCMMTLASTLGILVIYWNIEDSYKKGHGVMWPLAMVGVIFTVVSLGENSFLWDSFCILTFIGIFVLTAAILDLLYCAVFGEEDK